MLLHDIDRALLVQMIENRPGRSDGFSAVLETLAWIAAAKEDALPPGPERERWAVAVQVATQATVVTRAVGL